MRITVKIRPRSSKNELKVLPSGDYEARVTAPPEDGKANQALIHLVADHFQTSRSMVHIRSGETARTKILEVGG